MLKVLEKIVDVISNIVFEQGTMREKKSSSKKDDYVLSSIFPNTKIMEEVKKHI